MIETVNAIRGGAIEFTDEDYSIFDDYFTNDRQLSDEEHSDFEPDLGDNNEESENIPNILELASSNTDFNNMVTQVAFLQLSLKSNYV